VSAGSTRDYDECRAPQRTSPWPWPSYGEEQCLTAASEERESERIVRGSHAAPASFGYRDGMRNVFRNIAEIPDSADEDTIELMLSPEQMRVLSSAAATEAPAPAVPAPPPQAEVTPTISVLDASPDRAPPPPSRRHWPAGGVAAIVGVTVVLGTLAALGAIAQRTSERKHPAAAVPAPTPVVAAAPTATPPPPPPGEPVRFKNPFDRSEVFEFPPGTSPAEARQAVAELLMERGRDRHVQFVERKRGAVRRTAVRRSGSGSVGVDLAQNSVRVVR
jgi:hypothetical protein